jgi:hypothetical protein
MIGTTAQTICKASDHSDHTIGPPCLNPHKLLSTPLHLAHMEQYHAARLLSKGGIAAQAS